MSETLDLPPPQTPTEAPIGRLIGEWRRFGEAGPVYEVVGLGRSPAGGERTLRVQVLETGETLDYRLADLLADPIAD